MSEKHTNLPVYADGTRIVPAGASSAIATTNCGNHTHDNEANAERFALCWNHHDKLVAALENIMAICGNLPDDRYQTRCGPNTSTDRGIKVVAMRRIARETLAQCKPRKDGN